jgi:hypothetical protein
MLQFMGERTEPTAIPYVFAPRVAVLPTQTKSKKIFVHCDPSARAENFPRVALYYIPLHSRIHAVSFSLPKLRLISSNKR